MKWPLLSSVLALYLLIFMFSSETHTSESDLILALDVGTLSVRAIIYDRKGHQIVSASRGVQLNRISDVEIEQDAEEILNNLQEVMEEVLSSSDVVGRLVSVAGLLSPRSRGFFLG